jgi:hypothetical protein
MAAPVQGSGGTLRVGAIEEVLTRAWGINWNAYGIHPDGDKFLALTTDSQTGPVPISLFLNWQDELERR